MKRIQFASAQQILLHAVNTTLSFFMFRMSKIKSKQNKAFDVHPRFKENICGSELDGFEHILVFFLAVGVCGGLRPSASRDERRYGAVTIKTASSHAPVPSYLSL